MIHDEMLSARFWGRVLKSSGCWIWAGPKRRPGGYGLFWTGERRERSHRMSFRLSVGPIPEGLNVCHHCDNPSCVRPDHLFIGTHRDNVLDKHRKGRTGCGEQLRKSTLREHDIRWIRTMNGAISQAAMAKRYRVHPATINRIIRLKSWLHVK